jgi:hypothetical protein
MSMSYGVDPHPQLPELYLSLLTHRERFHELKRLLAHYDLTADQLDAEPVDAAFVREHLNERIRVWIGPQFTGLNAAQTLQWRGIIVEERFNVLEQESDA